MSRSARPRSYRIGHRTQINLGDTARVRRHPTSRREDAIIVGGRADVVRLASLLLLSLLKRRGA